MSDFDKTNKANVNIPKPIYYDVEHLEELYTQMRYANDFIKRDKVAVERELRACREAQATIETIKRDKQLRQALQFIENECVCGGTDSPSCIFCDQIDIINEIE